VYCNRSCLWVCDSGRAGVVRTLLQPARAVFASLWALFSISIVLYCHTGIFKCCNANMCVSHNTIKPLLTYYLLNVESRDFCARWVDFVQIDQHTCDDNCSCYYYTEHCWWRNDDDNNYNTSCHYDKCVSVIGLFTWGIFF